jgi:hypothetical protein
MLTKLASWKSRKKTTKEIGPYAALSEGIKVPAEVERSSPHRMSAAAGITEIGIFLLFLALAVLLQTAGGAFSSEMGYYPDEAAHYITGLMVRDYVASGFPGNPITFAERFYARFPKVAFGVWPPLFHGILAVWLLPTPDGRTSALLLMAFIMAATSYILYRCVRQAAGRICGVSIGLLLVLLPISQLMTNTIMADSLVMLTELTTAALLARWLRTGSNRDAHWVGVAAGLACMTKGNGMAVILAVPLAIALTRRFDLLRKSGIYVAGLIAALLAFGWELYALLLDRKISTFTDYSVAGVRGAFEFSFKFVCNTIGWALCALILLGLTVAAGSIKRRVGEWSLWASMVAVGLSVFVFHILLPHSMDGRYLLAGIAPLMVFLVPGARTIADTPPLARIVPRWRVPLVLSCALAIFFGFSFQVPKMPRFGFREAAAWLEKHPLAGGRYLVVSDSNGEGAFIAEVASRSDRRLPGPLVMRASKLLFVSDWNLTGYRLVFDGPEKALAAIEQLGISYIVMDSTQGLSQLPHWDQVRQMLHQYSDRVQMVQRFPANENGHVRSLDVYEVLHFANPPSRKFEFQTIYTRGGSIRE